jgi:hypothetical protein
MPSRAKFSSTAPLRIMRLRRSALIMPRVSSVSGTWKVMKSDLGQQVVEAHGLLDLGGQLPGALHGNLGS